jgi:hypothetical protein
MKKIQNLKNSKLFNELIKSKREIVVEEDFIKIVRCFRLFI